MESVKCGFVFIRLSFLVSKWGKDVLTRAMQMLKDHQPVTC